ncbi:MAG: hypothetical protein DRI65_11215 [Chloroflexota bacterium]|nr:hypothetical protein [Anaerolineales bacterium]RLD04177.1 MAG: hypothetical protein DRI65_11215 [Chloroflexota bacterium]HDD61254.1 hypothetical protein [Chloroflexota bacterium]
MNDWTWNTYYVETKRREDEIAQATQDRYIRSVEQACETRFTKLSIRMLDVVGSKLVEWGSQLQCRCAELTMTSSKRAI